jgi:hypothetical protein
MKRIIIFFALIATFGCSQENDVTIDNKNPADAGKGLRLLALTTSADKLGFILEKDYPKVYGVITDWNLGDQIASILAVKDGTASLYTTSTFGIIGGHEHDAMRKAAKEYVRIAGQYYEKSTPVSDYPYPKEGKVNFFLLTYDGVRLCIGDEEGINKGKDETTSLFVAAQNVLSALEKGGRSCRTCLTATRIESKLGLCLGASTKPLSSSLQNGKGAFSSQHETTADRVWSEVQ